MQTQYTRHLSYDNSKIMKNCFIIVNSCYISKRIYFNPLNTELNPICQ